MLELCLVLPLAAFSNRPVEEISEITTRTGPTINIFVGALECPALAEEGTLVQTKSLTMLCVPSHLFLMTGRWRKKS